MQKKVLSTIVSLILCGCTLVSGCTKEDLKIEKPVEASDKIDSYVSAAKEERYEITGSSTLEEGDYVVYPASGQICLISDGTVGQEFEKRDFVHVSKSLDVDITNGYLLPVDKAPAMNGEVVTDGVYLVGFDVLPEINKVGTNAMVVVSENIPELFTKATKTSYAKYSEFEAKDGMLVKLDSTYLVSRPSWDVQGRLSCFWDSYENTAIDSATMALSQLDYDKLWYAYLYALKYDAKEITGTLVSLDSTDESGKVVFTYNKKKYCISSNKAWTVVSDADAIKADTGTTLTQRSYRDFRQSGDKIDGTRFYILGDIYNVAALQEIEEYADTDAITSYTYLVPNDEDEKSTSLASELEDGNLLIRQLSDDSEPISGVTLNIYDAINNQLAPGLEVGLTGGSSVPKVDTTYGCYKIVSGGFTSNEPCVNDLDLSIGGDYLLLYKGCPAYTAIGDTKLEGASFDEALVYWRDRALGQVEEVAAKYTKTYTLEPETLMTIGTTMSANVYTFNEPVTVTVYPYATKRPRVYKSCTTLILQQGDIVSVPVTTVFSAKVTEEMDMAEKNAEATANGEVFKEYVVKKEAVVGQHIPAETYTVVNDVTVTVTRATDNSTEEFGVESEITLNDGDNIKVSEECTLLGKETPDIVSTENGYISYSTCASVGTDIVAGNYTVVGGKLNIGDKEYSIGDKVTLQDGDVTGDTWFVLEKEGQ